MDDKKVTDIKYKRLDKDPEIKKVTNEMEKMILGEKGVGILEALGLTPGKVQKSLDDEWEKEFNSLLAENKDYIFWEARKRSAVGVQKWLEGKKEIEENALKNVMQEELKRCEIEVIRELMEKNGMLY